MLHASASALGGAADVKQKRILLKRRPPHQPDFIGADPLQWLLDLLAPPVVAVDHGDDPRILFGNNHALELAHFYRTIHQLVVVVGRKSKPPRCRRFVRRASPQRRRRRPLLRHIRQSYLRALLAAVRHIQQNLREVQERMRGVQLGIKWPRVVPIDIVFDQNVPIAGDLPGLLIQFHHGHRMTIGVLGAQPGQTMRKIADLVERIPGRELHGQLLLHIRDAHLHVEFMLFGVRERNGISNRRRRGPRANHSRECQENTGQTRPANHCPALLRMQTHEPLPFRRRCSSSFSHKPSKLPLDITRITSPRRTSLATYSAMASADGKALASRPRERKTSATASGDKRSLSGSCCGRWTGPRTTASAAESASGNCPSNTLRRMEFERGSKAAHRRRPGQRSRAASRVSRIAVGWWAKSSTTSTPRSSPLISMRRRTFRNVPRAFSRDSRDTPRPRAR